MVVKKPTMSSVWLRDELAQRLPVDINVADVTARVFDMLSSTSENDALQTEVWRIVLTYSRADQGMEN